MPTVRVRPLARIDIVEIWEYIAEDSEARADALIDRLDGQFTLLALQPRMGRLRPELIEGMRSFPLDPYVIFDEVTSDGIGIVRVLHGARDINAQFHP